MLCRAVPCFAVLYLSYIPNYNARRSAVRCRAVPCRAVLCHAVPCFAVLSLSYIPNNNANKHTELARASILSSMLYSSAEPLFSIFFYVWVFFYAAPVYSNSNTAVVRTSMLSFSIRTASTLNSKAQHSTAQSPLHKAANQVRVDQSTHQKKNVRTCMLRLVCFPGAWSSWYLQVACSHLKCCTI